MFTSFSSRLFNVPSFSAYIPRCSFSSYTRKRRRWEGENHIPQIYHAKKARFKHLPIMVRSLLSFLVFKGEQDFKDGVALESCCYYLLFYTGFPSPFTVVAFCLPWPWNLLGAPEPGQPRGAQQQLLQRPPRQLRPHVPLVWRDQCKLRPLLTSMLSWIL